MAWVDIEPVHHGGDLDAARQQFPDAPQPWIDLSTGINPRCYPIGSIAAEAWQRLPQSSAELALREAAATRYGASASEMVVAAPGTQVIIQTLPRLVEPTDVVVLGPTYAEHGLAWGRHGHRVVESDSVDGVGDARVVIVVNPDNPTGRVIDRRTLRRVAGILREREGLLVVDEAFADFTPELSLVSELPPACVVLRSFGKAYGLAGLRLGFAIAATNLATRLRAEFGPWSVSGPGLAVGTAALSDREWIGAMKGSLVEDCRRLDSILRSAGLELVGGTCLFRLMQHTKARAIAQALARHGIWVRSFAARPSWLRFGLPGGEAAWLRLERALADTTSIP
jgi:cobalamin biosynthetic protein CobC